MCKKVRITDELIGTMGDFDYLQLLQCRQFILNAIIPDHALLENKEMLNRLPKEQIHYEDYFGIV